MLREAVITYRRTEFSLDAPSALGRMVRSSIDISRIASEWIGSGIVESFVVFGLDAKLRIVAACMVSRGGETSTSISMAEVARFAVLSASTGLVFAHNHPSGDATPSPDDIEFTRKARETLRALGIQLLDHVVVTDDPNRAVSFMDRGLLDGSTK
jgi:DNA repair protein RadC